MTQPDPRRPAPTDPGDPGRGRPRHRGRFMRFMRGYLMLAGAAATIYALVLLLVRLMVEIGAWTPAP